MRRSITQKCKGMLQRIKSASSSSDGTGNAQSIHHPSTSSHKALSDDVVKSVQQRRQQMWNENTLQSLRVSCFSRGKQRWRYTHNGKRALMRHARRGSQDSASGSGSSEGSSPTSPTSPENASTASIVSADPMYRKTTVKILTWNVDFMEDNRPTRLATVLDHIQTDVFGCSNLEQPEPCCVLLQEVSPEAFTEILQNEWIRQHFCVVPSSPDDWPSEHYGNVTLVSRTIPVMSAQMLQFGNSWMGRFALFTDLRLDAPRDTSSSDDDDESGPSFVTVRVANVHLESLPRGTPMRPDQLEATADMLRQEDLHAGVIAGDMNAITPDDGFIHEETGLLDAWTRDDGELDGQTWGHQPRCQFPPGRLDKIFYTSDERCVVGEPERVGVGLKTKEGQWASDHYGLWTTLEVI